MALLLCFFLCAVWGCGFSSAQTGAGTSTEEVTSNATDVTPYIMQCWECLSILQDGSLNPQCPRNGSVDTTRAYRGYCGQKCFSHTNGTNPDFLSRGCTANQWGLPDPLPDDGCYWWESRLELWCFCSMPDCNGETPGEAGNATIESYLQSLRQNSGGHGGSADTLLPPSLQAGSQVPGLVLCWQCVSYDSNGNYYSQCPFNDTVDVDRGYIDNCTGRCFGHSSTDKSGRQVMNRGCSSSQWGLPNPLPADGCYPWKSEVWCVCSSDGCNGVKLGTPGRVQFDAHVNKAMMTTTSACLWIIFLLPFLLSG